MRYSGTAISRKSADCWTAKATGLPRRKVILGNNLPRMCFQLRAQIKFDVLGNGQKNMLGRDGNKIEIVCNGRYAQKNFYLVTRVRDPSNYFGYIVLRNCKANKIVMKIMKAKMERKSMFQYSS